MWRSLASRCRSTVIGQTARNDINSLVGQSHAAVSRRSFSQEPSEFAKKIAQRTNATPTTTALIEKLKDEGYTGEYMDRLRGKINTTPEQSLEDLENEIKGEIACAIGRTEAVLLYWLAMMEQKNLRLQDLVAGSEEYDAEAHVFNKVRSKAIEARTNLIIHRQAAGFRINCYQDILDTYPIAKRKRTS